MNAPAHHGAHSSAAASCCSGTSNTSEGGGHPKHAHHHAEHGTHQHDHHPSHPAKGGMRDPVCGMIVDPHTAKHHHKHEEKTYYFCSAGCQAKFAAEPAKYLDPAPKQQLSVPEGTIYTCPMHPEVRQVGPGSCPICGMALEPETISLDDKPDPELIDMTRRFWIALALTLPVFVIDMTSHFGGVHLLPPIREEVRAPCHRSDRSRARSDGFLDASGRYRSCLQGR